MHTNVRAVTGSFLVAICLACLLAGATCAAAEDAATKQPDVNPRVLTFVKPVAAAESDDELTKKLKERHNVAVSLLEARVEEYKSGISDLTQVLEAARLVAEAKHELARDDAARLAVLEDALEVAKLIESYQQAKFEAGVGSRSDLLRARVARVAVEIQILRAKQATPAKQP